MDYFVTAKFIPSNDLRKKHPMVTGSNFVLNDILNSVILNYLYITCLILSR